MNELEGDWKIYVGLCEQESRLDVYLNDTLINSETPIPEGAICVVGECDYHDETSLQLKACLCLNGENAFYSVACTYDLIVNGKKTERIGYSASGTFILDSYKINDTLKMDDFTVWASDNSIRNAFESAQMKNEVLKAASGTVVYQIGYFEILLDDMDCGLTINDLGFTQVDLTIGS